MPTERRHLNITYDNLLAIARLMDSFPAPWYVSGGWAIDALVGRATRLHEDLEIGIARQDQGELHRHLAGWKLLKIVPVRDDFEIAEWRDGEYLELPIHQIIVQQEGFSPPEFEFFLNEVWDGEWRFRRDQSIRRPLDESYLLTEHGIPVIAPEIQLLYKARLHRPKDEHDFQTAQRYLTPPRRTWLKWALDRHWPGDPWLAALNES